MADILLSNAEIQYILESVNEGYRIDGRTCDDYRQLEIETRNLPNTNGSARCRVGKTEVIVGVKTEVVDVDIHRPNMGKVNITVDCSATASPQFVGRGSQEKEQEILSLLNLLYNSTEVLDLEKLCIVKGESCWALNIDVLFVQMGGNIYDAASFALKAALYSTTIPEVTVSGEGIEMELAISDDPYHVWKLDISNCPVCITLYQIGQSYAVDVTEEEEECSRGFLHVGVLPNRDVSAMEKSGAGNLDPHTLLHMVDSGVSIGSEIHRQLEKLLSSEGRTVTL